ncbi:MAG TPA: hypothetical protein VM266_16865 [Solirubrobacteraceae bacterium]|nr:hypothetical protein [Solirubrobacteraceae bacterium]
MAGASHQTVRLTRGRHPSPAGGACVMELASMLAHEPFSDRPRCVDPVIGAFLRAFNDRLDHRRRQELRPYAAAIVGTRGRRHDRRRRRDLCLAYASGSRRAGPRVRARLFLLIGAGAALDLDGGAGEWAAREAIARGDVDGGFALLDALLGRPLEAAPLALAIEGQAQLRVARPAAELVLQAQVAQEHEGGEHHHDAGGRSGLER